MEKACERIKTQNEIVVETKIQIARCDKFISNFARTTNWTFRKNGELLESFHGSGRKKEDELCDSFLFSFVSIVM